MAVAALAASPLRVSRFLAKQRRNALILRRVRKYADGLPCSCVDSAPYEGMWYTNECTGGCPSAMLAKLLAGERE